MRDSEMEEKTITKCPHCGGETHVQGVRFCPFCGNSLLGKTIVATNQSVKEEVNELEDRNLLKTDVTEYPTIPKGVVSTIVIMLVYTVISFFITISGIVKLFVGDELMTAIGMIIMGLSEMILFFVIALVYILRHVDDFRKRKLFKEGQKSFFDAEVRSYGTKSVKGKEQQFITIKGDCGGIKAFNVFSKNKKRQFYIGEPVKVTVSNGVYLLEKKIK